MVGVNQAELKVNAAVCICNIRMHHCLLGLVDNGEVIGRIDGNVAITSGVCRVDIFSPA